MLVARKRPDYHWIRDIATFAVTVAIACWQGWEARELIWGLWISSLVIGYAFILVSALSIYATGRIPGDRRIKGGPPEHVKALGMNVFVTVAAFFIFGSGSSVSWLVLLVNGLFAASALYLANGLKDRPGSATRAAAARFFACTPSVVFTLGFFTLHFGGFHFVHGMFLNQFFPIYDGTPFGDTIGGTLAYALGVAQAAARSFWPMVGVSAFSRLGDLRRAFEAKDGPNMMLPYVSVVKMHILIFVFAGMTGAGLQGWALYPVLILYFFPVGSILKGMAGAFREAAGPDGRSVEGLTDRREKSSENY